MKNNFELTDVSGEDVRVNLVHVGVDMVAHHVLVSPDTHGHASCTVVDGSQHLPHPGSVGHCKMTGKMSEGVWLIISPDERDHLMSCEVDMMRRELQMPHTQARRTLSHTPQLL